MSSHPIPASIHAFEGFAKSATLYDQRCKDLADDFLFADKTPFTAADRIALAVWIQKAIEAWFAERRKGRLARLEEIADQIHRELDYYRGLVVQIGEMLGETARMADDGTDMHEVLCAKVPKLVQARLARLTRLEEALTFVLPLAKGYAAAHPVGSNLAIALAAEVVLKSRLDDAGPEDE